MTPLDQFLSPIHNPLRQEEHNLDGYVRVQYGNFPSHLEVMHEKLLIDDKRGQLIPY